MEPIRLEEEDDDKCANNGVLVETGLGSSEQSLQARFGDDQDPSSDHKIQESILPVEDDAVLIEPWLEQSQRERVGDDEEGCAYNAVSTETGLESIEQLQRQRFGDDQDCFSEQSSSILETNRREEERQGGFANNELFLDCMEPSIRKRKRSSTDDDDPSSFSSMSEEEIAALTLIQLSCDKWQTQTQTLTQPLSQSQTHTTQPQTPTDFDLFKCSVCGKGFPSYQALGGHKAHHSHRVKLPQPLVKNPNPTETQPTPQMLLKSDSYKCSVCGKELPSYLALGRHKAGHRVKPILENAGEKTRVKTLAPSGKIHKCSICHKLFPTGQSVGGHKRSLDEEAVSQGDKLSPSGDGSAVTNVSDPNQRVKGLIDINKVPSPEFNEPTSET